MSYKLIKNQLGGGDYTVLIVIAVIVALWFFFIHSSKKSKSKEVEKVKEEGEKVKDEGEKDKKKVTERYSQYIPSMFSYPESIASDSLNFKTRPAVDLKSPGMPYFEIPARLAALKMKRALKRKGDKRSSRRSSVKSISSKRSIPVSIRSTPVSSRKSTPVSAVSSVKSTPLSSRKTTPVSSVKSTPVSSRKSTPVSSVKSTPVSSRKSTPVVSARSSPIVVPKKIPLLKKSSKKVIEKMTDVNNLHSVKDTYNLKTPLSASVCSQKCCGYYWKGDNMDEMFKKNDPVGWDDVGVGRKFRTSNVTCMGDGVAPPGCRCYTGDQQNLLSTRGGNGSRQY